VSNFSRNLYRYVMGCEPPRSPRRKARRGPPRDREYLTWIRSLRCCVCGRSPRNEAAHVGRDGGKGVKCSDYATIPLCAQCHRIGPDSYHDGKKTFAALHLIDYDALVSKYNSIWEKLQGVKIFAGLPERLNKPATAQSSTGYQAVDESAEEAS